MSTTAYEIIGNWADILTVCLDWHKKSKYSSLVCCEGNSTHKEWVMRNVLPCHDIHPSCIMGVIVCKISAWINGKHFFVIQHDILSQICKLREYHNKFYNYFIHSLFVQTKTFDYFKSNIPMNQGNKSIVHHGRLWVKLIITNACLKSLLKGLRMVARALWRSEARRVVPWSETLAVAKAQP